MRSHTCLVFYIIFCLVFIIFIFRISEGRIRLTKETAVEIGMSDFILFLEWSLLRAHNILFSYYFGRTNN